MSWEKILKYKMAQQKLIETASVYKDGRISFSHDLYDAIDSNYIEIFVDRVKLVIGIKPTIANDPDAYHLTFNKKGARPVFRATKIFHILGYVDIPYGRKQAKWDKKSGMIIITL